MRLEAIDVYWVKLPLAFVWRTSYADQRFTDTILVRMEGGGHYAWGEACPVYIPAYSAEHTTMIIVTHELGFAREIAERILFMDQGRIVEEGTPEHFFTSPAHERTKLFLSQIL